MKKRIISFILLSLIVSLAKTAHAWPPIFDEDVLPPPDGEYVTQPGDNITFGNTATIDGMSLREFVDWWTLEYAYDCEPRYTEARGNTWGMVYDDKGLPHQLIDIDGDTGATFQTTSCWVDGSVTTLNETFEFSAMISDNLIFRESPILDSIGVTIVRELGNGTFEIESFFDVWTELSIDSGDTWIPADDSIRMILVPEPTTLLLLGLGALVLRRKRS